MTETIYERYKNVHAASVQDSIVTAVQNLKQDQVSEPSRPLPKLKDIMRSNLPSNTKYLIQSYCTNDYIMPRYGITYKELIRLVWRRIIESPFSSEMCRILTSELEIAGQICLPGSFASTIAVLDGFYEDIRITVSESDRIAAIIIHTKRHLRSYDALVHHDLARSRLLELGYSDAAVRPWLGAILGLDTDGCPTTALRDINLA